MNDLRGPQSKLGSRLLRRFIFAVLGIFSLFAASQFFSHLVFRTGYYGTGLLGFFRTATDSISDKSLAQVAQAISNVDRLPSVPVPTPLDRIPAFAERRLDRRVDFSNYLDDILYQSVDGRSRLLIPRRGGWYRMIELGHWEYYSEIDTLDDGWPRPRILTDSEREKYIQHYKELLLERHDPVAVRGLVAFGEPAVPALIEIVQDESAGILSVELAVRSLGNIGASPNRVIPAIEPYLYDPRAGAAAAEAIGSFGPAAESALPSLAKAVDHPKSEIRHAAVIAVGRIGRVASSHQNSIHARLTDTSVKVRAAAARSLGQIGASSAGVIADLKALADVSSKSSEEEKRAALESLALLQIPYSEIYPFLVDLYRTRNWRYQLSAVQAAGSYGAEAIPFLIERYRNWNSGEVRDSAMQYIRNMGSAAAPQIDQMLMSDVAEQQANALDIMRYCPDMARIALPSLMKLYRTKPFNKDLDRSYANDLARGKYTGLPVVLVLALIPDVAAAPILDSMNDGNPESIPKARFALREMGIGAVPALLAALNNRGTPSRRNALEALAGMGDAVRAIVPEIAQNLSDPDPHVRYLASEALAGGEARLQSGIWENVHEIRPIYAHVRELEPAAQSLIRALGDPNEKVARNAALALSKIPPADISAAVPALTRLLGSPNRSVRTQAAKTLGMIGPAARSAVPEMIRLLRAEVPRYRAGESEVPEIAGALALIRDERAAPVFAGVVPVEHFYGLKALVLLGSAAKPAFQELKKIYDKYGKFVSEQNLSTGSYRSYQNVNDVYVYAIRRIFLQMGGPGLDFLEQKMRSNPSFDLSVFGTGSVPPEEISRLLKWLNGDDKRFQFAAVLALDRVGSSAAPAVPGLMELVESDDPHTRLWAIHALGQIGPAAAPAVDQLVDALSENNLRDVAKFALAGIGKPAIPAVLRMIHKGTDPAKPYDGRCLGLDILGAMGKDAASVSGDIAKYVHADISVSARAFWALGAGGSAGAAAAMPEIILFLKTNPSDGFLQAAVDALGKMGSRAAPAVPELRRILAAGKHEGMRSKIQDLIHKIDLSAPSSGDRT